jgi:hypothetical protein
VSGEGLSYYVGHTLDAALARLREQVHVGLLFECGDEDGSTSVASARAVEVTRAFASRLPEVRAAIDDVIIYAGATVLGRITVGRGSTVGGNVWLTQSVAPGTHVSQAQSRQHSFDNGAGL